MKNLIRIFPVLFLILAAALPAQVPAGAEGASAPGSAEHSAAEGHDTPVQDMDDKAFFVSNFVHLLPHALWGGAHGDDSHGDAPMAFYDTNLFQAIAVVLILLVFSLVGGSFRTSGNTGGFFVRVFRGWCHWLRDEVVYPVMGREEGSKWAPFFLYLFFFLAFLNLLGMVPVVGRTATASFYVTGTMAVIIFACMLFFGFKQQGVVKFFVNLLPHGLPWILVPLMAVVELIGLLIKPFALMVRLFANMLGGHMVMYSFLGMIFLFAKLVDMNTGLSILTAVPAVGMSVFINIIEGFIALLQAYIFTYLSVIFIQQAMHPAH